MKVEIYSRKAIEKLKSTGFPTNTAVISFFTPTNKNNCEKNRVDYSDVCKHVFYVEAPDIDIEILSEIEKSGKQQKSLSRIGFEDDGRKSIPLWI